MGGFACVVAFDNMQQQDAHEFLNYLLNTIADLLDGEWKHIEVHHFSYQCSISKLKADSQYDARQMLC